MYIESQKDELSFADLIRAAEEKTCESKSFPYKYHVCRCRNCAYCYQGKENVPSENLCAKLMRGGVPRDTLKRFTEEGEMKV